MTRVYEKLTTYRSTSWGAGKRARASHAGSRVSSTRVLASHLRGFSHLTRLRRLFGARHVVLVRHAGAILRDGATEEDLRTCASKCDPNERILAVWRVPKEMIGRATRGSVCATPLLFMPCFWPHMVILSPFICAAYFAIENTLEGTTYFLTDKALHIVRDVDCCGGCYRSGNDYGSVALNEIKSIAVNNAASGACGCCYSFSSLDVGVPISSPAATLVAGTKHERAAQLRMFISDVNEARSLVQQAKENFLGSAAGGAFAGGSSRRGPCTRGVGEGRRRSRGGGGTAADKIMQLKMLLDAGGHHVGGVRDEEEGTAREHVRRDARGRRRVEEYRRSFGN